MSEATPDMEQEIVDRFLEGVESSDRVSDEVFEVLDDLSGDEDFGGREMLGERVLEVKREDED